MYKVENDNEHSGMGIIIMKSLSNSFEIHSTKGLGTKVVIKKQIAVSLNKDEARTI